MDSLSLAVIIPPIYLIFVTSITPGPNNIMLAASGMNFGYKRSLPHLIGIFSGFGLLIILCAVGIGSLYENYPILRTILRFLSAAYLIYLSYKIVTAGKTKLKDSGKPLTWLEAASFQFINPKAWVMSLTFISSFMPDFSSLWLEIAFMLAIGICINFPCTSVWVLFGKVMARLFTSDKTRKIINYLMAGMLLLMIPILVLL